MTKFELKKYKNNTPENRKYYFFPTLLSYKASDGFYCQKYLI